MKTKIGDASPLHLTAPTGGTVSGRGVLIGKLFGIAVTTNVAGDVVACEATGEFDHAAEGAGSGQAWAIGDDVYWDATNLRLTKTSSGNTRVGVATAAKATTDTIGRFVIRQPA